jgi:hypothetical protein
MPQYMLLLYHDPSGWMKMSPEEMQKAIERYMAWTKKPYNVGSIRLAEDNGRVMQSESGKTRVTDGPYVETKEVLGGYYLIEAANYNEAIERTRDHPHLEYGGRIDVRETFAM